MAFIFLFAFKKIIVIGEEYTSCSSIFVGIERKALKELKLLMAAAFETYIAELTIT